MLFSFVAAGLAMFALARAISGHVGGALIAGLVFAFDPFRFSHYSHLELEFSFWMPLAALCVLRTLATGDRGAGVLAGALVALQGLSSLYLGAYFALSLTVLVQCRIGVFGRPTRRALVPLGVVVLIGTATAALVTIPYWANRSTLGERSVDEIRAYSARGRDYLTASRRSALYGMRLFEREGGERELFPGTAPLLLGAAALLPPLEPAAVVVAVTLATSVDASLGLNGTIRDPSRAGLFSDRSRAGSISSHRRAVPRAISGCWGRCYRAANRIRLAESRDALGHRSRGARGCPSRDRAAASLEPRARNLQVRARSPFGAGRSATALGSGRVLA